MSRRAPERLDGLTWRPSLPGVGGPDVEQVSFEVAVVGGQGAGEPAALVHAPRTPFSMFDCRWALTSPWQLAQLWARPPWCVCWNLLTATSWQALQSLTSKPTWPGGDSPARTCLGRAPVNSSSAAKENPKRGPFMT